MPQWFIRTMVPMQQIRIYIFHKRSLFARKLRDERPNGNWYVDRFGSFIHLIVYLRTACWVRPVVNRPVVNIVSDYQSMSLHLRPWLRLQSLFRTNGTHANSVGKACTNGRAGCSTAERSGSTGKYTNVFPDFGVATHQGWHQCSVAYNRVPFAHSARTLGRGARRCWC